VVSSYLLAPVKLGPQTPLPPRPSLPPPGAPSRGQARVCPHCMLKRPGSGLQHRRAAQAARTQPPPPAYIGDPAATLEAAVAHFASVRGGAAHLNCTLCQIAIRESTRLEQLARRLPYEQGPDETPQASPPSSSSSSSSSQPSSSSAQSSVSSSSLSALSLPSSFSGQEPAPSSSPSSSTLPLSSPSGSSTQPFSSVAPSGQSGTTQPFGLGSWVFSPVRDPSIVSSQDTVAFGYSSSSTLSGVDHAPAAAAPVFGPGGSASSTTSDAEHAVVAAAALPLAVTSSAESAAQTSREPIYWSDLPNGHEAWTTYWETRSDISSSTTSHDSGRIPASFRSVCQQ
jgi:hypothetical protein